MEEHYDNIKKIIFAQLILFVVIVLPIDIASYFHYTPFPKIEAYIGCLGIFAYFSAFITAHIPWNGRPSFYKDLIK